MKLRHAAALVIAGWYLMVPPRIQTVPNGIDDHAPLSRWFAYSSYDAAHECEGAKFLNREGHKPLDDPMHQAFEQAQCIASDDPRLKEK